jgi:D-alanyl-D-alanine carboxypeptidase
VRFRGEVEAPGAILGVLFPDGKSVVVATGVADVASSRPMSVGDAFFLGSISKTYTATTVLRLVEEGRVSLDMPLSRFVPSFPRGDEITIRQLLRHTTGLKDFYSYLYFRPDRDEMIAHRGLEA